MVNRLTIDRALSSEGKSNEAIYETVARLVGNKVGRSIDVGCGRGHLHNFLDLSKQEYIGVDIIRYLDFPEKYQFIQSNLDTYCIDVSDNYADITCSLETIEHLENPRAFMRELFRITKPGGLLIVTTPNQLSLLSKLTLIFKNQFNAFQAAPGCYPAHITALLEIDLIRIAAECQLTSIEIHYPNHGRIPATSYAWPQWLGFRGRLFSDNAILSALKPVNVSK
ncbi:methyltransferase domain-containing protein [Chamaesiphon sp. VAR_48_metabat_135_sub]|uniref:class I SAM-dependent methyltransferase n=1 Tax=Chamaesiphon sp. VAR_48_metabat_135_sub TaxID=2964699 RepID=UPI00286C815D|nr:methyltransferase domain-containing protein [Chamaesiphon sp. VAR_48_metabat_135_sub]